MSSGASTVITASQQVKTTPGFLLGVTVRSTAQGITTITLHDGTDNTGRKILSLSSSANSVCFIPEIGGFSNVYANMTGAAGEATIVYI